MRIVRALVTVAATVAATFALTTGTAAAAPATPSPSVTSTQSSATWVITVKRATYPTLWAERDRVMQQAKDAGFSVSYACAEPTTGCQDSFLVTEVGYRTLVTTFRYDPAIVSIEPFEG